MAESIQRLRGAIETSKRDKKKNPSVLILAEEITRRFLAFLLAALLRKDVKMNHQ